MSETLQQDFVDPDVAALSKEELAELQRVNAETILELEADIKLLEKKSNSLGHKLQAAKIIGPDGTNNIKQLEIELHRQIVDYTARLKETMRLTGITIENINRQVLELDDTHSKIQFSLELLVLNRNVHLTFYLEELLSGTSSSDQGAKVTWFKIQFEEDINQEVGADVARSADELAIHSVFSLLKSFLRWQTDRDQLMAHFAEMYPENVSELMSEERQKYLKISNPKPNHPEFIIDWSRKRVNDRVEPDIKVDVRAPSQLLEMDSKNILAVIPDMFSSMATTLGLEKALDCLIQLVATDGQGPQQDFQQTVGD